MLDPQARALLDLIKASGRPPMNTMTAPQARADYRSRRFVVQPDAPDVSAVLEHRVPVAGTTIPVRAYRPIDVDADEALPALVYLHGGGWTVGDRDTHDVLCRSLANGARCAVFSVDYRMGPEHRFPAAVDDTLAALRWVVARAAALRIDATRLAVGGDSAGGNLAAVAALAARDEGAPRLALQLLIYPATDMRMQHDSHRRNGEGYLLTRDLMHWFRDHYIDASRLEDWRASPLLASDHRGVAPALVLTAGFDPLVDEGLDYAGRLSAAGVPVEAVSFDGQIHGFITMGRLIADADRAIARCCQALRAAFAR